MNHTLKLLFTAVLFFSFAISFAQHSKTNNSSRLGVDVLANESFSSVQDVLATDLKTDLLQINKGDRCNYLHENLILPTKSSSGALYSYKVKGRGIDKTGKVKLSKKTQRASLKISLKQGNVSVDTVLSIKIAPDDNKTAYLFAHFCSNSFEGQQLRYALSTKDNPLLFKTMLNGNPVVAGDTIASTKAVRDPHILRGSDGYFYMTMTDMDCNKGWWSNHAMVLMKSRNLVNWQHVSIDFKTKYPEWEMNGATAVWAPQTIWDPTCVNSDGSKGRFMVYYGLFSAGKNTIHTYYSYTNDDFTDLLGTPVELVSNGTQNEDHIDADCIWSEVDSQYHMYYTHRGIKKKVSTSLTANNWTAVNEGKSYNENFGEGSAICRLINSNSYLMLFDDQGGVYYYSFSHDNMNTFEKFARLDKSYINPRHGTMLTINKNEQELLQKWDILYQLISELTPKLTKSNVELEMALANAKLSLQMGWNTSIENVSKAISKSIKTLEKYNQRF